MLNEVKHLAKSLAKSQRGILHDVQDDRDLWVNCYIISPNNGFLLILHRNHQCLGRLYSVVSLLQLLLHTLTLSSGAH